VGLGIDAPERGMRFACRPPLAWAASIAGNDPDRVVVSGEPSRRFRNANSCDDPSRVLVDPRDEVVGRVASPDRVAGARVPDDGETAGNDAADDRQRFAGRPVELPDSAAVLVSHPERVARVVGGDRRLFGAAGDVRADAERLDCRTWVQHADSPIAKFKWRMPGRATVPDPQLSITRDNVDRSGEAEGVVELPLSRQDPRDGGVADVGDVDV